MDFVIAGLHGFCHRGFAWTLLALLCNKYGFYYHWFVTSMVPPIPHPTLAELKCAHRATNHAHALTHETHIG